MALRYLIEHISKVATKFPKIFSYNIENNLKPTIKYIFEQLHGTVNDLISFPAYVSYSLENRIKPRHEFLKKKGKNNVKLKQILIPGDKEFAEKVAKSTVEEYQMFKEEFLAGY